MKEPWRALKFMMTEQDREKLVTDLANYVAGMAPHQKERMSGQLILRAYEALKSICITINPAWETAEYGLENMDFKTLQEIIQQEKERLTANGIPSMTQHGPDNIGPVTGNADHSN